MKSDFLAKGNKIAVVGASTNPEKFGYKIYRELKLAGFCVYPINRNAARYSPTRASRTWAHCPKNRTS